MNKNQTVFQPFLTSHSIYLRVIEEEDVTNGIWHHWYNNYQLTAFNQHGVYPINTEDERKFFQDNQSNSQQISLAVCSLEDDSVIGTVSLDNIDLLNRKAEVACTIAKNITLTIGLESIGLMIQHGMDRLNLNKICGGANEGLKDWVKMMRCLGFIEEGILKQESLRDGKFSDVIRFGLLAEDYYRLMAEREGLYLFKSAELLYKNALENIRPS